MLNQQNLGNAGRLNSQTARHATLKIKMAFAYMVFSSVHAFAAPSIWYKQGDPLNTGIQSLPKLPESESYSEAPCPQIDLTKPLTLAEVANTSLCNNPQTREVWANARVQAAQLGVAKSAYLPTVTANLASNLNVFTPESPVRNNPALNVGSSLVANYLLYDFGNRDAALENARQLLLSASASQSSTVQTVLLAATVTFFQTQANIAAVEAALEAERASRESFKAAEARYLAGVSTPADQLQAQTAYAQLTLSRITSEGNLQTAYGNLASIMGLPANQRVVLVVGSATPPASTLADVNALIEQASTRRPDLMASEAQLKAALATVDASKAAAKPTLSVSMSNTLQDGSNLAASGNTALGITLSIPLFNGYAPSYRILAAEATADLRAAQRDRLRLQISLDVWTAYQNLRTALQSVTASDLLLKSADASYSVALGRYKAGVGNMIDTLNAQSALASARQQKIQATLNTNIARATLAQAIGALDNAMIQSLPDGTPNGA